MVTFEAHCPGSAVKVYVVVVVLSIAGDQVPVIPLLLVDGSVKVLPEHIGSTESNSGVIEETTVSSIVSSAGNEHAGLVTVAVIKTEPEVTEGVKVVRVLVVLEKLPSEELQVTDGSIPSKFAIKSMVLPEQITPAPEIVTDGAGLTGTIIVVVFEH